MRSRRGVREKEKNPDPYFFERVLAPEEKIDMTVKKQTQAGRKRVEKDPWKEIKGVLSHEEAEEMRQVIAAGRRSRIEAPDVGEP